MKNNLLTIAFVFLSCVAYGQKWSREQLRLANTAENVSYLNREEKNMIFFLNLIRMDGPLFFKTYFQDYVNENNQEMKKYGNYTDLRIERSNKYYRSLEKDLKNIKDLPLIYPDRALSKISEAHANDMNRNNLVSHDSSNGDTFVERISNIYPNHSMAENLAFGSVTGLEIMCALLLDMRVPGLGHRKNILNTSMKFTHVGVSIKPHPFYRISGVMDFISFPDTAVKRNVAKKNKK